MLTQSGPTEPADPGSSAGVPGSTAGIQRAVHPPQHLFSEVRERWAEIPEATDPAYSQAETRSEYFLVRSDVL